MAKRKDILNELKFSLENLGLFKDIYIGKAPEPNQIQNFPACAIVFDDEIRDDKEIYSNCYTKYLHIDILLYNKQKNVKYYEDVLSDIIEQVDEELFNFTTQDVFDSFVFKIENSKGLILPYQVALLKLRVKYI